MSREFFRSFLSDFGVQSHFREEKYEHWNYVYQNLAFQGVLESDINIAYQISYFSNYSHTDLSVVLYKKKW